MKKELYTKNLIIGGGISGLTLAYYLKDDYIILEKESEVGGYCRTIKNSNFIWDFAGHFYHFKNEKMKKLFLSLVEPEQIINQKKITKIYFENDLIDYPFQMNIHQLKKERFIECLYDLYFKKEKDNYDNFLDMLYGKFGNGIVESFLKPYNEKLYAVDLKKLDKNAMGRFFPYADIDAIISNFRHKKNSSYNDSFLYLKQGTQYFIDKLLNKIDSNRVSLNTEVCKIDTSRKRVMTNDGQTITYENLINTMPLNKFLGLINVDYKNTISKMSYNKVLVLNMGFDKKSPKYTNEHWVYFPDKSLNFYRVGFYDNILKTDKLNVYVEIGYSKDDIINLDEQIELTLNGMNRVGIINDSMKLVDKSIVIMDPAYVHISEDTEDELNKIQRDLASQQVFTIGRYGKWTYCSMEDCMIWSKELYDKIKNTSN